MEPEKYHFKEDELAPNNPDLLVLIYSEAFEKQDGLDDVMEKTFTKNGWGGIWRDGIFDYVHFHSNAHEVLGIAKGTVTVRLGGDLGIDFLLTAGDVVVLPAGTGHKKISGSSDLLVVAAYPKGQENYDIHKSWKDNPSVKNNIKAVALPQKDPLTGGRFVIS